MGLFDLQVADWARRPVPGGAKERERRYFKDLQVDKVDSDRLYGRISRMPDMETQS